ncbi:unnamed protein product, partial [Effrenium voratum]
DFSFELSRLGDMTAFDMSGVTAKRILKIVELTHGSLPGAPGGGCAPDLARRVLGACLGQARPGG